MLVTMEVIVWVSFFRFLRVDSVVLCLELFQSMFTKIMLTPVVLCSSDTVTEPVEHVEAAHAEHIALAVAVATA